MSTYEELEPEEELVLSDLLNHVLDKGVVISGEVIIGVGDIDLIQVKLSVLISSVETLARAARQRDARELRDADVPLLPGDVG